MANNSRDAGPPMIIDLGDIGPDDLATVGGKALNLGRLLRAGLPVPTGFCVTTSAYREALGPRLREVMAAARADDPDRGDLDHSNQDRSNHVRSNLDRSDGAERARRIVQAVPLPDQLVTAISDHYRSLGDDVPVAVRSSATAEDLADASFAGQQDTYLNVIGVEAVLAATSRCWASLFTDRALSYRDTQGIDDAEVALAVVVQRMIAAEVAGVMFTANPVTGTRSQLVIDASPGLGESVVSGSVNPDRFVLNAQTGTIVDQRLGDKRTAVQPRAAGGTETTELSATSEPCLDRQQLGALVELAARVADVYEVPQDTEWAIDTRGRAWLTQARAITTLYPMPTETRDGDRAYLCASLAQGLTRPITPMGQQSFRLMGSSVAAVAGFPQPDPLRGPSTIVLIGERVFADITGLLRRRGLRRLLIKIAGVMEFRTQAVIRLLEDDPRFGPLPRSQQGGHPLPIVARIMLRTRLPLRLLTGLVSPSAAHRAIDRVEHSVRERWRARPELTPVERVDVVQHRLGTDTFLIMPVTFAYAAGGLLSNAVARRLAPRDLDPGLFADVRRGLPHNVTTEMDLELWRLATKIGKQPDAVATMIDTDPAALAAAYQRGELAPVISTGLRGFLDQYGHRAVAEIDLGMPRWSEQPDHLLGVLANYLRLTDPDLAPDRQFAHGAEVADSAVARIVAATRRDGPTGPLRARLVAAALQRARSLMGLRERPKSIMVFALAAARRELLVAGEAAVAAGGIDSGDDAFFLDLRQLRQALTGADQRSAVAANRAAYAAELRRRHIPRVLLSDGTEPETMIRTAAAEGSLQGSPASVGSVTGTARVIVDPAGAHLEPGEILVAPSTDPGWTPLFLTAGGLVMEMGGSMSHGAVVAREYGIPAVVGVPDATSKITSGQTITVDGAAGTVTVAEVEATTA